MTDAIFKERELKAPGYLDGIYILDWTAIGAAASQPAPAEPEETPKRASGDKVALQFKYCSHQLDLSKRTLREALKKGNHHVSERWINTLYDNYEQTLLRTSSNNFHRMTGGMEDDERARRQRELAEWWERHQRDREGNIDVRG
ncbi:MAG: hypothetical protein ACKPKO_52520, partial [Candidatus Fonsibacter sp.]